MDFRILVVVFLGVAILLEAIVLVFHITSFNSTGAKKFKFYTYIPFELSFRVPTLSSVLSNKEYESYFIAVLRKIISWIIIGIPNFMLVLSMLCFALYVQFNGGDITAAYILFTVFTLASFFFVVLTHLKLSYYSSHMLFTTLFVASTLLLLSLYIFFFTNDHYNFGNGIINKEVQITNFVISLILLIFEFGLMLNKNYKNRFKMVKVDAETYNRPKFCYLAILEWGTLLNLFLAFIPVLIIIYL